MLTVKKIMKESLLLILFLTLSLSSCLTKQKTPPAQKSLTAYDLRYPLPKSLISGHRGAKAYPNYPENCLETFQYLRSKMDCIIECDVARTKDSILVLMHDKSINRTTNGAGNITDLTYSEIKNLQLKDAEGNLSNYKIPTFSDVLKWAITSNTILTVDIKRSAKINAIINEIKSHRAEPNCVMISYTADMSQQIFDLAPNMMQSVSIRNQEELTRWEQHKIPPASKTIAFTGTRQSPKKLYDALHQYGIPCIFGTLGNIDNQAEAKGGAIYKRLLEKGVDIIATDRPLEVDAILNE